MDSMESAWQGYWARVQPSQGAGVGQALFDATVSVQRAAFMSGALHAIRVLVEFMRDKAIDDRELLDYIDTLVREMPKPGAH